jgi:hypothetical protein
MSWKRWQFHYKGGRYKKRQSNAQWIDEIAREVEADERGRIFPLDREVDLPETKVVPSVDAAWPYHGDEVPIDIASDRAFLRHTLEARKQEIEARRKANGGSLFPPGHGYTVPCPICGAKRDKHCTGDYKNMPSSMHMERWFRAQRWAKKLGAKAAG